MLYKVIVLLALLISNTCVLGQGQPACLTSLGTTIYRVNGDGTGAIESFPNQRGAVVAMTLVPPGVEVTGCTAGDVIAVEAVAGGRLWRVDGARAGSLTLSKIGQLPQSLNSVSLAFAHDRMFGINEVAQFYELNPLTLQQIGPSIDLRPNPGEYHIGGLAFDGIRNWYITNAQTFKLVRLGDPPSSGTWVALGYVGYDFDKSGLETYGSQLWGALRGTGNNLRIGTFNVNTGVFTHVWMAATNTTAQPVGFVTYTHECLDVTVQPTPQSICPSGTAAFTVATAFWSGIGLAYRWQIEAAPVGSGNWSDLFDGAINGSAAIASGTSSATLSIENAQFAASRRYRCHASNSCATTVSNPVLLTIQPDITGDHAVNVNDLLSVINSWGPCPAPPASCASDVAPPGGDGQVNVNDLLAVINGWGPCP